MGSRWRLAEMSKVLVGRQRLWAALVGGGILCLLGVAAMLSPNQRGYRTHEQLGLPPCSFYALFGRRCPTCGSTTAFARLVRGDWSGALRANVGGAILGAIAAVASPWLLLSAARGRWFGPAPTGAMAAWGAGAILVIMLVDWVVRLMLG
jgi:hypothetical protein